MGNERFSLPFTTISHVSLVLGDPPTYIAEYIITYLHWTLIQTLIYFYLGALLSGCAVFMVV